MPTTDERFLQIGRRSRENPWAGRTRRLAMMLLVVLVFYILYAILQWDLLSIGACYFVALLVMLPTPKGWHDGEV